MLRHYTTKVNSCAFFTQFAGRQGTKTMYCFLFVCRCYQCTAVSSTETKPPSLLRAGAQTKETHWPDLVFKYSTFADAFARVTWPVTAAGNPSKRKACWPLCNTRRVRGCSGARGRALLECGLGTVVGRASTGTP